MILLFSDYDGTLKSSDDKPSFLESIHVDLNKKAIKEFMDVGNKFIITTGRSPESLINNNKKYGYIYNYITAYDGRVTLDKNNRLVYAKYLEKELLLKIKELLKNESYKGLLLENEYGKTKELENLIVLEIIKPSEYLVEKIKEESRKCSDIEFEYSKIFNIIYLSTKCNKKDGVAELINKEQFNVKKENIITVGDSINDIEMLEYYNGYKMVLSDPRLYFKIPNTTTSVKNLIKELKLK